MSQSEPFADLTSAERRLARSVAPFVPELGLNRASLAAGAHSLGLSDGERDLIAPNGGADIAAILWRDHDAVLDTPQMQRDLAGKKIREKIAHLLNSRLDAAAGDERLLRHLMGFFALPHHAAAYHRRLWATADAIWRLAGDRALDENHYSKRVIVCGILSTALLTRLSQGREAQTRQVAQNIDSVMAFEKFKAGLPARPETLFVNLAEQLGRLRFGAQV